MRFFVIYPVEVFLKNTVIVISGSSSNCCFCCCCCFVFEFFDFFKLFSEETAGLVSYVVAFLIDIIIIAETNYTVIVQNNLKNFTKTTIITFSIIFFSIFRIDFARTDVFIVKKFNTVIKIFSLIFFINFVKID